MVPEDYGATLQALKKFEAYRCVNCGEILDEQIIENRGPQNLDKQMTKTCSYRTEKKYLTMPPRSNKLQF